MPTEVIEAKKVRLEELLAQFEQATLEERTELEQNTPELAAIVTITPEATAYLQRVRGDAGTDVQAGAENENYIYTDEAGERRVIKMSKERHDYDAISVLKLMRNMCALELFERQYPSFGTMQTGRMKIDMLYDDMMVFKDEQGHYKRMIRQRFVEGASVGQMLKEKDVPYEFTEAWKKFLEQIGLLQVTAEVSLDITDSTQGVKPSRGNVAQTNNVIVESPGEPTGEYIFHVIDLDVFDDPLMDTLAEKGRQHKFYATEQLRKRGSILGAIKVFLTNMSRELYVKPMQDRYTKREMEK